MRLNHTAKILELFPINNLEREEKGYLLAEFLNILIRQMKYIQELLIIHRFNYVRNTEI
jgi:hypothetical protein